MLNIANHQLKELALIDELTGIPNRRSFRNYIDVAFQNHVGKNSVMSVIMVDIDSFKDFNDHYGHNEGDKVLIAVANQINSIVKHALDFAARWGGEEFIYVSFDKEEADIEKVAETIRQKVYSLKIPHEFSQTCEYVTVSIGAAAISILGKRDVSKAIELADQALYSAKRNGRNCVKSIF